MSGAPRPHQAAFDVFMMVDWSAASAPATGADSIWIATLRRGAAAAELSNPSTRARAMSAISGALAAAAAAGERVLIGFDFPFGYPAGVAARITDGGDWRALWARLAELVREGEKNANTRLDAAAALNAHWPGDGPFWGNGLKRDIDGLSRKKPGGYGETSPPQWRLIERRQRARGGVGGNPKSVWQLAGAGSVGGQALTGIAALERLRQDPRLRGAIEIWPFETGLAAPTKPICVAEVYPSIRPVAPRAGEVKDAAQVRELVEWFAGLDAAGALPALFAAAPDLTPAQKEAIVREEAWILGAEAAAEAEAEAEAALKRTNEDVDAELES